MFTVAEAFSLSFLSLLQWKLGHTPVCNIKPTHPSVKCTLTSPLSQGQFHAAFKAIKSHWVSLALGAGQLRNVYNRDPHTLVQTHILDLYLTICFSPKTFLLAFVSPFFLFFLSSKLSISLAISLFSYSLFSPLADTSACMLCCWSEWRKGAWPQETRRGGETFDARSPDRS